MIYGYTRCSTTERQQDITRQCRELTAMGAEEIYLEYESGAKINRTQLNRLLKAVVPGDTIVVTEISRITRSTKQLCDIIDLAVNKKLKLVIGTLTVDCADIDPMTEGMIKLMGVFAEMERGMTISRIKSGLKNAKAKGVKLGRPPLRAENIPIVVQKHFYLYRDGHINKAQFARLCGVSLPTIYKYIRLLTDG